MDLLSDSRDTAVIGTSASASSSAPSFPRYKEAIMKTNSRGFTCPHCKSQFLIGGYSPGVIQCGRCGKAFQLR